MATRAWRRSPRRALAAAILGANARNSLFVRVHQTRKTFVDGCSLRSARVLSSGVTPTPPPTSTTAVHGLVMTLVALWPNNPSIFTLNVPSEDFFAAASRLDVHEDGPPKALT
eukprot:scaffold15587_cov73-Phaeocystis_antarctica.AAC.3